MTRRTAFVVATVVFTSAIACHSTTGPHVTALSISGPDSAVAQGMVVADDTVDRVGCIALLKATVAPAADSVTLDSATAAYSTLDGTSLGTAHLSRDTLVTLGFQPTVDSGVDNIANIAFYSTAPWSLLTRLYYTTINTAAHGVASYRLRCVPAGPLLAGRYVLISINGAPLPFFSSGSGSTLYYDTLAFFPPDMSYVQIDKYNDGVSTFSVVGGFNAYEITARDTFNFPFVTKGDGPAVGAVSGDTLAMIGGYSFGATGQPIFVFAHVPGTDSIASAGHFEVPTLPHSVGVVRAPSAKHR